MARNGRDEGRDICRWDDVDYRGSPFADREESKQGLSLFRAIPALILIRMRDNYGAMNTRTGTAMDQFPVPKTISGSNKHNIRAPKKGES